MKRFKFTLIELLVVIAIIGILASILLPVLGKARKKSQAAVCKSNQKQLGVAFTMYLDDSKLALPYRDGNVTFDDLLSDYDGRSGLSQTEKELSGINETTNAGLGSALYECPSDRVDRNANIVGNYLRSYSISANINGSNAWAGIYGVNVGTSREFSEINSPSSVLTFVEYNMQYNSLGHDWASYASAEFVYNQAILANGYVHDQKSNYTFVDGHVESLGFYSTLQTSAGIATESDVTGSMWDATR